jgi:hypothetical protein
VDKNYLDLGMNKSGFVHTLPSGTLKRDQIKLTKIIIQCRNSTYMAGVQLYIWTKKILYWLQWREENHDPMTRLGAYS